MRLSDLFEAPISDFEIHGDLDREGSFQKDDLRKMADPSWRVRVVNIFRHNPFDIKLYIINGGEGSFIKTTDGGFHADIENAFFSSNPYGGIADSKFAQSILGDNWKGDAYYKNSINAILLHNEGAGRIALTPWMVAHRMAHAVFANGKISKISHVGHLISNILSDVYQLASKHYDEIDPKSVVKHLSSFKSAQSGTVLGVNEWSIDVIAQYLTRGKATFLRDESGHDLKTMSRSLSPDQIRAMNYASTYAGFKVKDVLQNQLEREASSYLRDINVVLGTDLDMDQYKQVVKMMIEMNDADMFNLSLAYYEEKFNETMELVLNDITGMFAVL